MLLETLATIYFLKIVFKNSVKNFLTFISHLKKIRIFSFPHWHLKLPFDISKQFCHIISIWKNSPKISPKLCHFQRVGDDFTYETKLHWQKNCIRMFTTSILKCLKKKLQNNFKYFQVIEIYFSNCHNCKGPIQVFTRTL